MRRLGYLRWRREIDRRDIGNKNGLVGNRGNRLVGNWRRSRRDLDPMNLGGHWSEAPHQKQCAEDGCEREKRFVFHHLVLREMGREVREKREAFSVNGYPLFVIGEVRGQNGACGARDIERKAARAAASERGQ